MADLELTLSWLEMSHYLERFVEAGFESWETVLEITEDDLEILNVDLGHRRKLQREIANTKRLARDPAFVTPLYGSQQAGEPLAQDEESQQGPAKRGYRHHPKPDPNAPDRPYSAYVMFSNHVREELKNRSLTFTEISRQVGERWQALTPAERDTWKQKAAVPWEKYKADVADYQETEEFQEYQQYLNNFKVVQASKKPRRESSVQAGPGTSRPYSSMSQQSLVSPKLTPRGYTAGPPGTPSKSKSKSMASQMVPTSSRQREIKREESKIAISRIKKEETPYGNLGEETVSARVRQACEPCRQKKTKCHGEKPVCKHCRELDVDCYYADGKRGQEKQTVEDLRNKLSAYETLLLQFIPQLERNDQQAVQDALSLPPQVETSRKMQRPRPLNDMVSSRSSSQGGGESDASGIGSMGNTDHVNQDDFFDEATDTLSRAFAGQASDLKWRQRLKKELDQKPNEDLDSKSHPSSQNPWSAQNTGPPQETRILQPYSEDMETSVAGDLVDPYDLPIEGTANALVNTYFTTVHPSFPVLDKAYFIRQFGVLFNTMDPAVVGDRSFLATVHLVFAIGAVHAHLTRADWVGDVRDYSLYFARARKLAVERGILGDIAYMGQVQVFGLAGMYMLVTDQINRAWNVTGLAIRCAQSLGMHLINATPSTPPAGKVIHAQAWFAVASLERILTVMTGRPSMINVQDCSVSISQAFEDEGPTIATSSSERSQLGMRDIGSRASPSSRSQSTPGSFQGGPFEPSRTSAATAYFTHYIELATLANEAVATLYRPGIRHSKWSDIQGMIADLDRKLERWSANLPRPFKPSSHAQIPEVESYRVALGILMHSTRTIINRPCLCRLDRRIIDQSAVSKQANFGAVNKCVESARAILDIVFTSPDNILLQKGTMWWMLLHHVNRALTVLLLELSFRAEHMPAEAEGILAESKKAINWLRLMGAHSIAARRSWVTMSRLLDAAAQKVGGDTADIVIAPSASAQQPQMQHQSGPSSQPQYTPIRRRPYDPNDPGTWPPLDPHGGMDFQFPGQFFGDLAARSELDQFGFWPREAADMQNVFPSTIKAEDYPIGGGGFGQESGWELDFLSERGRE